VSAPRTPDTRRAAEQRGRGAERQAAWLLRLKGYRVLARHFRSPVGEVDLIVRRGGTLAFVEVKARPTQAEARDAIGPRQQARIARAAEAFLAQRPDLAQLDLRFDAVLLVPGARPCHMIDAWRTAGPAGKTLG
jgi:putative endonuclease